MKRFFFFTSKEVARPVELGLVAGFLGVFSAITLATIGNSSIWFDESFGAYMIRFNFAEIFHFTALDVHPPLYYWLLKLWSLVFGNSDVALRSMSVLFGVVALVFAYLLIRKLFSQKAALWTLPLLVVMPFFVRYAQEARMYTLVVAIALAATYVLTFAVTEKKWKWWIIYGVLVALGMWTHYFTALIWLAHWVWRGIDIYKPKMRFTQFMKDFFTRQWIVAHGIALGLFVAWLPLLVYQLVIVQSRGFWIPPIDPSTIPSYLTTVLYYLTSGETSPWLTVLFLITMIAWIVVARRAYRPLMATHRRWIILLISMAVVPVVLLIFGSLPPLQSSFVDRYLLAASVVLVMITGAMVVHVPKDTITRRLVAVLAVLLIGGMSIGVSNVYYFGNFNKSTGGKSNAKELIAKVDAASSGNEPIIADTPWLFYDTVHYATDQHQVYFINATTEYRYGSLEMLRTSDMFKIKDLSAFEKMHQFVWYIDLTKGDAAPSPVPAWQPVKTISLADPYTGKPAYHAVLYKTF